jgi:hypothetical protein
VPDLPDRLVSNSRKLRRQTSRAVPAYVEHFADGYRCPDCDADRTLVEEAPDVYTLRVAHDDTCPAYRGVTG